MKRLLFVSILTLTVHQFCAQQKTNSKREINCIIDAYSKSVIEKDSMAFYGLFNDGDVTWCASIKDRSQTKELKENGVTETRSNYYSGSYKQFMRVLFRYRSTEDKFDNIQIIEDGAVASVTMDYSFWANNKMTNWGCKYLTLIKRDGNWKITSVIYSIELTTYFEQPPLKERKKQKKN